MLQPLGSSQFTLLSQLLIIQLHPALWHVAAIQRDLPHEEHVPPQYLMEIPTHTNNSISASEKECGLHSNDLPAATSHFPSAPGLVACLLQIAFLMDRDD